MSTTKPQTQERTAVRPDYFPLGVDETGAEHVCCTKGATDTVHVVRDGERELVQDLGEKAIDEWMGYVDAKRGWDPRRYGRSLVDKLVAGMEAEA